jgi:hypothetical protein
LQVRGGHHENTNAWSALYNIGGMLKDIDQCWKNVRGVKQNPKNVKGH